MFACNGILLIMKVERGETFVTRKVIQHYVK